MKMLIRILIAPVVSLLLLPCVALSQESGEMSREERRAAWEAMTPEERNAKRTEMRERAEMRDIEIIKSDDENNLLYLKGSIPGSKNTEATWQSKNAEATRTIKPGISLKNSLQVSLGTTPCPSQNDGSGINLLY